MGVGMEGRVGRVGWGWGWGEVAHLLHVRVYHVTLKKAFRCSLVAYCGIRSQAMGQTFAVTALQAVYKGTIKGVLQCYCDLRDALWRGEGEGRRGEGEGRRGEGEGRRGEGEGRRGEGEGRRGEGEGGEGKERGRRGEERGRRGEERGRRGEERGRR